jgi:hypothetical protein
MADAQRAPLNDQTDISGARARAFELDKGVDAVRAALEMLRIRRRLAERSS